MGEKELRDHLTQIQNALGIHTIGEDDIEETNKKAFREWMATQVKLGGDSDAGKPYTGDAINSYVNGIESTPCPLDESKNLFYTRNKKVVAQSLKNLASKSESASKYNAVKKYYQFVGGTVSDDVVYKTGLSSVFSHNRVFFGAPGTGKSYTLNKEKIDLLNDSSDDYYERVTFHPDYSYANFVGTYKPVMKAIKDYSISGDKSEILSTLIDKNKTAQEKYNLLYEKFRGDSLTRLPILLGLYTDETFKTKKIDGSETAGDNSVERNHGRAIRPYVNLFTDIAESKEIAYEYVPGPFMRVLVKALKSAMTDSPRNYLLIIEEINRANVAAVFGDVFQLLDRNESNVSEYEIATSSDMRAYLASELCVEESQVETIRIPDNMYIWATMNSADQGVFPMDTAFKRRWDFTYIGIDDAEADMSTFIRDRQFVFGTGDYARLVTWNEIRRAINNELSSEAYNINEDKLLGPYFIAKKALEGTEAEFLMAFKNKVLMYLFEDAVKQRKRTFFENCKHDTKGITYSEIVKLFNIKGVYIFPDSISGQFVTKPHVETTV